MKMGEKIVQTAGRDRSNHNPCHHVCRLAEGLGYLPSCKGCMEGRGGGQVMRRMISVLAAVLLALGLTACGNSEGQATNGAAQTPQAESPQETEIANSTEETTEQTEADVSASNISEVAPEETGSENGDGGVLVVYFSATGTTKDVAEKIAAITGADTYEIKAAQEYSDADLNWSDSNSRSTKEQNDSSARPEIGSDAIALDGYTTIYIGERVIIGTSQGKAA